MRISDWSSDVCSSDLNEPERTVYGGRIVALWEPLENLSATLIYQHDKYEERGQTQHLIKDGTGIGTNVSIEALAASIGQTDFEVGKLFSYNDYPERFPYDNQKSDRVTLIADRSEEHTSELQSLMRIS